MQCIKTLATYTCSNATGTTCTKVAATVYVPSTNTTCVAGEFAILTQAEKTTVDGYGTSISTLQSGVTGAQNTATAAQSAASAANAGLTTTNGNLTATNNSVATLQTSVGTLPADVATLKGQMQLIAAGSSLLGTQPPSVENMQAEAVVFGAALACAAVVWGAKQMHRLFFPSSYGTE